MYIYICGTKFPELGTFVSQYSAFKWLEYMKQIQTSLVWKNIDLNKVEVK